MPLTTRQKKDLKARGQKMGDDAHVGKGGSSAALRAHVRSLLARSELVKVRFAEKLEGEARKAFADDLAAAVEAECIAVVGRTVLLYKEKPVEA
jgi:RNA-binding protein YhbY